MSYSKHAAVKAIEYPESDGKPMAETDAHINTIIDLRESLKEYFFDDPQVYVSGNILLYYEEDDARKRISPDLMIVSGVAKHERRVYLLWEEGVAPSVVFEISSRGTVKEDLEHKRELYAQFGVPEYYLFDPEYDYLKNGLIALRLVNGAYDEVVVPHGEIYSPALELDLVDTGKTLRFRDPKTGLFLPVRSERRALQEQAEKKAQAESTARLQAEAARLQAEEKAAAESAARLQAEEKAEAESAARLQAEEKAQAESAARLQAEAEIARLREELERLRTQS